MAVENVIKIRAKKPSSKATFEYIIERLNKSARDSSDMKDVFSVITPWIRDTMRHVFSEANPSGWANLKSRYRAWKVKKGYPVTIGIMTGALRTSVSTKAITKFRKKSMLYQLNPAVSGMQRGTAKSRNVKVGKYAKYFNRRRPIFGYASEFLNDKIKEFVEKYIADEMKS